MIAMSRNMIASWVLVILMLASTSSSEDYQLQYFLEKTSSKGYELSKKERTELLNRLEDVLGQAKQIHSKLLRVIQGGEIDIKYQDGKYWMSKLEKDQDSIDIGAQQLKILSEKPMDLIASIKLYKSLKDLSFNFNTCNNMPSFSAYIGDLAPEIELWADPVFYQLYLLPLAYSKDREIKSPKKEKPTVPKGKK